MYRRPFRAGRAFRRRPIIIAPRVMGPRRLGMGPRFGLGGCWMGIFPGLCLLLVLVVVLFRVF